MNPPQRVSSETAQCQGKVCRMQQVGAPVGHQLQQPTRLHSCATGARDTTNTSYYTPSVYQQNQFLACRRASLSASQFLLAPLPSLITRFLPSTMNLFMVNRHPTNMAYMRASGDFMLTIWRLVHNFGRFWVADVPGFEPGSPA